MFDYLRRFANNFHLPIKKKPDFSSLSSQEKITGNLELLSMHIPKTAGTSFYSILQQAYGIPAVMRMDYRPVYKCFIVNDKPYHAKTLPRNTRVLHGHLNARVISKYLKLNNNTKMITWIRNPVERVISDYYYMLGILKKRFDQDPLHPSILDRTTKSLLEFARNDQEQNKIFKYLKGLDLEQFFFVGIVEKFDEEIATLGESLHWQTVATAKQNITPKKPVSVSKEIYASIKELNHKDWSIYEQALILREKRPKSND